MLKVAEGGYAEWDSRVYAEWDRRGLGGMGQKEAMRNGAEGSYAEWGRRGLCGMGQKEAMRNVDSGTECLT